ncbi:hypothetical protein KFK09_011963 [Dendrobium nobile]|uniref:Uncharacterized protein n=1 Tax=Dendrobium nobile TaxID=94219 RepID=A0A8T3BG08_DENNO|nr:hypothetical protein KFK09_011963 [Dendrobium nobile]
MRGMKCPYVYYDMASLDGLELLWQVHLPLGWEIKFKKASLLLLCHGLIVLLLLLILSQELRIIAQPVVVPSSLIISSLKRSPPTSFAVSVTIYPLSILA